MWGRDDGCNMIVVSSVGEDGFCEQFVENGEGFLGNRSMVMFMDVQCFLKQFGGGRRGKGGAFFDALEGRGELAKGFYCLVGFGWRED